MATQVDSLKNRSLKTHRPWRRPKSSPGHKTKDDGSASNILSSSYSSSIASVRQATSGTNKGPNMDSPSPSSPSPSPIHPSSGCRPRTRAATPVPALSLSLPLSLSPSSSSVDPLIASRCGAGIAYTSNRAARSTTGSPLDGDYRDDIDLQPHDSQHDQPEEGTSLPSSHSRQTSSGSMGKTPQSAQPTARPGRGLRLRPAPLQTSGRPSLKRRRALSDVDGSNTGVLCCKKRRLRRFLITSRLSQPFSQPASHILNRESVASGDKRFLKLAAIMNARRIRTPQAVAGVLPAAEAMWRAAMANRFRRRILADAAMGRSITGAPMQLMNNARLIMVPVSTAASMAAVRASGVSVSGPIPVGRAATSSVAHPAMVRSPLASTYTVHRANTQAPARQASPYQPATLSTTQVALVRPASAPTHRGRSHSRSPPLRPEQDCTPVRDNCHKPDEEDYPRPSLVYEDNCAFPANEHEGRYETDDYDDDDDRPNDEVYADFSVLFGSSGDETDGGSGNDEGLDDYMDELDGIAHLPR